jgi:hypothetical protein
MFACSILTKWYSGLLEVEEGGFDMITIEGTGSLYRRSCARGYDEDR